MTENTPSKPKLHSSHALLALLGQKCQDEKLLDLFHQTIKIEQKTVVHSPTDKLQDALVTMLMGKQTIYETNTTLSTEPALWQAWGRTGCADQSGIQRTLEACTPANVAQLQHFNTLFLRKHGQVANHDYTTGPLIIDGDLTGLPCSKSYEAATPGYFADCPHGTTGRQLFRFSAAAYNEIVYQQVFAGNTGSSNLANFKQVLAALFSALGLTPSQKGQVLLRLDGGFGTTAIIEYLLAEGYQFVLKLFSTSRATKLCREVSEWQDDPKQVGRSAALLTSAPAYLNAQGQAQPVLQIGVRCQLKAKAATNKVSKGQLKAKKNGIKPAAVADERYSYHLLVVKRAGLAEVIEGELKLELLLGQLHFYDQRASIESASFCGDKQGLGLAKRRKRSLVGQEMLIGLAELSHNLIIWMRNQLSQGQTETKVAQYGIKCWVRDWFGLKGRVTFKDGRIVKVRLPKRHELTRQFETVLVGWATQSGVRLILHQT